MPTGKHGSQNLRLCHSLISYKLDYGLLIHDSVRDSCLKLLHPVHHQGLPGCITLVQNFYTDAVEPPLPFRPLKLILSYVCRLKTHSNNHAYTVFHLHWWIFHFLYVALSWCTFFAGIQTRIYLSSKLFLLTTLTTAFQFQFYTIHAGHLHRNKLIVFIWAPAHASIVGNVLADQALRQSAIHLVLCQWDTLGQNKLYVIIPCLFGVGACSLFSVFSPYYQSCFIVLINLTIARHDLAFVVDTALNTINQPLSPLYNLPRSVLPAVTRRIRVNKRRGRQQRRLCEIPCCS